METVAWAPISDGQRGIDQILRTLTAVKNFYGARPEIRAAALAIAGGGAEDDDAGHVARLATFVRRGMLYVKDPIDAELTQTPDVLLLEINRSGRAPGDCDDHVVLFCALAQSLGIFASVVAVKTPGAQLWDHVIARVLVNGEPQQIDLCAKFGQQPEYPETYSLEAP